MRVHYFQHVPFEDLAAMKLFFERRKFEVTSTKFYLNEVLPSLDSFDWLIVMGGSMGVYDEEESQWLKTEKEFIKLAVDKGKTVLGICLGAQLLAGALGAKVYKNKEKEIGWFPVKFTEEIKSTKLKNVFPQEAEVFHWHGDIFEIPNGAVRIAYSKACENQGFVYGEKVVGLQFHLETMQNSAIALLENCKDDLDYSKFVQSKEEIISVPGRFEKINNLMFKLLEELEKQTVGF